MKTLSNYMENDQTEAFKRFGAFFAFSNRQLNEAKVQGVEYVACGSGLISPKENAKLLMDELGRIHIEARKKDLRENGIVGIVKREIHNYECGYTGELEDVFDALKNYEEITREKIVETFSEMRLEGAFDDY
jgi:hypothetical protein